MGIAELSEFWSISFSMGVNLNLYYMLFEGYKNMKVLWCCVLTVGQNGRIGEEEEEEEEEY